MRNTATLLLSIFVGFIAFILVLKLLGAALKLIWILIVLALLVAAFVIVRGMIEGGGRGRRG